jgi:hypothetical protein
MSVLGPESYSLLDALTLLEDVLLQNIPDCVLLLLNLV